MLQAQERAARLLIVSVAAFAVAVAGFPPVAEAACGRRVPLTGGSLDGRRPLCPPASTGGEESSVPVPRLEGPITGGSGAPFVAGTSFALADVGYEAVEYFISGTAAAYVNASAIGSDGRWRVAEASTAPYKTRILVYRPIDPARFNGIAFLEWLNVSGGLDAAPVWITGHVELMREGYAWIGVSAQWAGVEGPSGIPGLNLGGLKINDPERYGSLSHPGDSFSYDIYSQAGQAVRHGDGPLGQLEAEILIAAGESQSASRMTTYVNAIHPVANVFDAFLVHSRGAGSAALSQDPQPEIRTPANVRIRTDDDEPVLQFQTESDTIRHVPARQPDLGRHRLWEVAGTAHADTYTLLIGWTDLGDDPAIADVVVTAEPIPGIIECTSPINSGPQHYVLNAAIHALERWVRTGSGPRPSPRLDVEGTPYAFALDDVGNVEGGIRTPWVDAPVAVLSGLGQTGAQFCSLFGTTVPLDEAELRALYPDHETYVAAVARSADRAVRFGYLLEEDAELIKLRAEQVDIGG
ncbi:MAG: hypothetical protein FJ144_23775 [Deltaproteobacteria bacterium]|nr:hypothetical protein [Deltaproteobacteria bacterium]